MRTQLYKDSLYGNGDGPEERRERSQRGREEVGIYGYIQKDNLSGAQISDSVRVLVLILILVLVHPLALHSYINRNQRLDQCYAFEKRSGPFAGQ